MPETPEEKRARELSQSAHARVALRKKRADFYERYRKVHAYLLNSEVERLAAIADRQGQTRVELVREILRDYLATADDNPPKSKGWKKP